MGILQVFYVFIANKTHFLQCSSHLRNALAKLSVISVMPTLPTSLKMVQGQGQGCKLPLQLEKRKKSAAARAWE
jgi:hypothetical protein